MKPDPESVPLLRRLHERVFTAPEVRAVLAAAFGGLATELRNRPDPPHAACVVPIEVFTGCEAGEGAGLHAGRKTGSRQGQVRLCRAFLLLRGARMAVPERHRNSVQHLVSYRGGGCIHQGVPGGGPTELAPRMICSPGERMDTGNGGPVSDQTDLGRHWDIVPAGVWHFPAAWEEEDWATVTFHSAREDEIVDELWDW